MPLSNPQAAQAWREIHAPPRKWKAKSATPSPITPSRSKPPSASTTVDKMETTVSKPETEAATAPASVDTTDLPCDPAESPAQSLRNARSAERVSYRQLERFQADRTASIEDIRKANQIYITSRNNRAKADQDFKEWQRAEGITLFLSEAQELVARPLIAVGNLLRDGPKMLVPRLQGMPAKSQEKTLADFFDGIAELLRKSI